MSEESLPVEQSCSPLRAVVGLGNPGKKYEETRHNIGFLVVDEFVRQFSMNWQREKTWEADVAKDESFLVAKPLTFMNESGRSVSRINRFFKIHPAETLIIYDDMDLPLGKMRLRPQGSAGGHNGMKSIIAHLGTQDFPRLRLGIGRTDRSTENVGHVLGKFQSSEWPSVRDVIARSVDCVTMILRNGLAPAMNHFNTQSNQP